ENGFLPTRGGWRLVDFTTKRGADRGVRSVVTYRVSPGAVPKSAPEHWRTYRPKSNRATGPGNVLFDGIDSSTSLVVVLWNSSRGRIGGTYRVSQGFCVEPTVSVRITPETV